MKTIILIVLFLLIIDTGYSQGLVKHHFPELALGTSPKMMVDNDNNLFILKNQKLWEINPERTEVLEFFQNHFTDYQMQNFFIDENNSIWFINDLNYDYNFYKYSNGILEQIPIPNLEIFESGYVSLLTVRNDNLWIVVDRSTGSRMAKYDGEKWYQFTQENGFPETTNITSIITNNDGDIWISTADKGIFSFDGTSWKSYNTENGLVSNNIRLIFISNNMNIYLLINEGMQVYNGIEWKFYKYHSLEQ